MPAAWAAAATVVSGGLAYMGASEQADAQEDAARQASEAGRNQLDFDKEVYYDSRPYIQATQRQSLESAGLQNQIARDQAGRSATSWNQTQQIAGPAAQQVGLNALGAQYLSPEEQQELIGLQQTLSRGAMAEGQAQFAAGAGSGPQMQPRQMTQAQLTRLRELQGNQTESQQPQTTASPGRWAFGAQTSEGNDWNFVQDEVKQPRRFTDAESSELQSLLEMERASRGEPSQAGDQVPPGVIRTPDRGIKTPQGVVNGPSMIAPPPGKPPISQATATGGLADSKTMDAARARMQQLQNRANQAAQQRETDKANLITGTADRFAGEIGTLGEDNAQSILGDSAGLQSGLLTRGAARRGEQEKFFDDQGNEIKKTAKQRAEDFQRRAGEQANAAISSSSDQANRQLLRLGGDPNRMAAMGLDTANNQQLARISAGNQIADVNIRNLNAADDRARDMSRTGFERGTTLQYSDQDQAFGIRSAALDAARASRTGARQAAIGMRFGASQQADTIKGNARDVADTRLNLLSQGGANMGLGFANTSANAAQTAISGGTAGVNSANVGANAGLGAAGLVNQGFSGMQQGARTALAAAQGTPRSAAGLGTAVGGIKDLYNQWSNRNQSNGLGSVSAQSNGQWDVPGTVAPPSYTPDASDFW